ncbi:hypothetical protein WDW86_21825 [Bdellovibrionota bacterium FG-2]
MPSLKLESETEINGAIATPTLALVAFALKFTIGAGMVIVKEFETAVPPEPDPDNAKLFPA